MNDFTSISENKILIHGGGKIATELCKQLDIEPKMVDGRRITDKDNMEACAQCHGGTFGTSFGDVKFFYDFDGTVMDYLVSVFVTQAEFDDAQLEQQQIDAKQNARLFACEQKLGMTIGYK